MTDKALREKVRLKAHQELLRRSLLDADKERGHVMGPIQGPNAAGVIFSDCRLRSCRRSAMTLPDGTLTGSATSSVCERFTDPTEPQDAEA